MYRPEEAWRVPEDGGTRFRALCIAWRPETGHLTRSSVPLWRQDDTLAPRSTSSSAQAGDSTAHHPTECATSLRRIPVRRAMQPITRSLARADPPPAERRGFAALRSAGGLGGRSTAPHVTKPRR